MPAFDPRRLLGRRFRFDCAHPAVGLQEVPLHIPSGPLGEQVVETWLLRIDLSELDRAALADLLSEPERQHLSACTHPAVADRYLFSRATLRSLLGACLERDPAGLNIDVAAGGKPFLDEACGGARLQFNLSHSGSWLLVALAGGRAVGADIEDDRPRPRMMQIAERFYHQAERRMLLSVSEPERQALFLRCWTLKEAHAKALGVGLRMDLSETDYSDLLNPSAPTRWRGRKGEWWVLPLPALQGAIATVFAESL